MPLHPSLEGAKMKKLLAPILGLAVASPAHALSIVSLHGSIPCNVQAASTPVGLSLLVVCIAALTAAVAFRVYRREILHRRTPSSQ
jgi:hypothetical protein